MPIDPNFVGNFSCFRNISEDQKRKVSQIANLICYPPNHVIFKEGEPGKNLYFLSKGKIEILYDIGEEGQAHVETISGEEVVGCSALMEPYTYSASMRSLSEIEVLVVDAASLRELMQKDCKFGFILQQQIIKFLMIRILDLRLLSRQP